MARKTTSRGKMPKFTVGPVRVRATRGPKDGAWYWRAVVYQDGSEHTLWTAWATKEAAQAQIAAKVAAGDAVPVARPTEAIPRTVLDLMETWLFNYCERPDLKQKSKTVARYYARRIAAAMGNLPLRQVQYADLEAYRDARLREDAAPNVVNHELGAFLNAWKWGRQRNYCPDRDIMRVPVRVRPKRLKRTPAIEDAARILQQMNPTKWWHVATLVLATTGIRVGELAALRWKDVDLDTARLNVPDVCKTGWRQVPLTASTVATLRAWRGTAHDETRVFAVGEDTIRTSLSQRHLKVACVAAGVPVVTPHGFRRMVVNALYCSGIDPTVAAAIAGHSPQTSQRYYRQVSKEAMVAAFNSTALGTL